MSSFASFEAMFTQATGQTRYEYQRRLANESSGTVLLRVPTGCGKTAAAVLGWLWRRRFHPDASMRDATPRRLVYCLPMRVLVEQTRDEVVGWLHRLGVLGGQAQFKDDTRGPASSYEPSWREPTGIAVSVLMGGEDDGAWDIFPERDAVLIGTQDMLLSRALNRGYGMSRYRWPLHFGLLSNDAHWVVDEVQLMGSGLPTTVQLDAFRRRMGTLGPVSTLWMSATASTQWLATVDQPRPIALMEMSAGERAAGSLADLCAARKTLSRAECVMGDHDRLADEVVARHAGGRTLVVVNTVSRAIELYRALRRRLPGQDARLVLVHSRFRPADRAHAVRALLGEPQGAGTIAVATQVVEAGVNVTSRVLFTEVAPWASLVQRFGRCNRNGEEAAAQVVWIDVPQGEKDQAKVVPPYELDALLEARSLLEKCTDVGPARLPEVELRLREAAIVRRKDAIELFDTTPDLAGRDVDVSRFVRETQDHDVRVFWRDVPDTGPLDDAPGPGRDELCAAAITEVRELSKRLPMWRWDALEEHWDKVRPGSPLVPGMTLLLAAESGRYSPETGWDHRSKVPVTVIDPPLAETPGERGYEVDWVGAPAWLTLRDHTDQVVARVGGLTRELGLPADLAAALVEAARWHDAGKAHPVFQAAVRRHAAADAPFGLLAKSPGRRIRYGRPRFRHELASGLLALLHGRADLVAYLAATHHGKVRLSIRALPGEARPSDPDRRFARGVWDGDETLEADLGGGVIVPATTMDLGFMELGTGPRGPSWLARSLALRDRPDLGPFRLAFLEALLKVADELASGGVP